MRKLRFRKTKQLAQSHTASILVRHSLSPRLLMVSPGLVHYKRQHQLQTWKTEWIRMKIAIYKMEVARAFFREDISAQSWFLTISLIKSLINSLTFTLWCCHRICLNIIALIIHDSYCTQFISLYLSLFLEQCFPKCG